MLEDDGDETRTRTIPVRKFEIRHLSLCTVGPWTKEAFDSIIDEYSSEIAFDLSGIPTIREIQVDGDS